jgi:hypothetical protein
MYVNHGEPETRDHAVLDAMEFVVVEDADRAEYDPDGIFAAIAKKTNEEAAIQTAEHVYPDAE